MIDLAADRRDICWLTRPRWRVQHRSVSGRCPTGVRSRHLVLPSWLVSIRDRRVESMTRAPLAAQTDKACWSFVISEAATSLQTSYRMTERRFGSHAAKGRSGDDGPQSARHGVVSDALPATARVPGARRRRVLFALTELEYPTPSLRRVAAVATAIDGDLYVLRVLPSLASASSGDLHHEITGGRAGLAARGTIAWWRRTLLLPCGAENIQVRIGEFATEVSAHARLLGAVCIILAPARTDGAGTTTALMRACRQPVFSTPGADQEWAALLVAAKAADRR